LASAAGASSVLVTGFSSTFGSAFSTGASSTFAGSSVLGYSVAYGTGSSAFAFSSTGGSDLGASLGAGCCSYINAGIVVSALFLEALFYDATLPLV